MKFLYGLCAAKYVLTSKWLEVSAKAGQFVIEDDYWVPRIEENFTCEIEKVVKSPSKQTLFENKVFYLTPSIVPRASFLREIIELCGGKVEKNRRSILKIQEQNNQLANSYVIITCPQDLHLLTFKQFVCYACTSEFVMQSLMNQSINFSPHSLKYW